MLSDLSAEAFFFLPNRLIFQTAMQMAADGFPVDVVTLDAELEKRGLNKQTGGMAYLIGLCQNTPSAANVGRYAKLVSDFAAERELRFAAEEIERLATEREGRSIADRQAEAVALLDKISTAAAGRSEEMSYTDALRATLKHFDRINELDGMLGLRPYAVFVRNSDVLGFRYEMRQGRPVCTQFRYRQAVTEYDGDFGERTVEQINVHEAGRVRRYRMDKDGKWLIHSEADQSRNGEPLGFVPVVDLVLEKTGFFAGRPPLMELAYLNVKHWQSQSDQDNIVHYVRVPLLQYRGSEDVQNVVAAAGNMISVGADGELNYVEHSGAAISAGVTAIEKLETDMQAAGAKLLTRTKLALTESQARDEAGREISLLRHYPNKDSILKGSGASGSGAAPSGSNGSRTMSRADFEALDPASRMKALQDKTQII